MDSFLETARRCQNALVPYLSKSLGISLKQSLSDVIKDIQNGKVDLGAVINDLLCGYWETYGKKLKSYRDRSQHFANVVSDARVFWSDEGKVSLYLLLPNNPEVNDPSKWEYENPHTHAYLYAKNQLHKLIVTVYCITRFLGDKVLKRPTSDTTKQFTLRPVQLRAPITLGEGARNEGIRLLTEHDMKYEFTTTLQKCHQMYEAHIGPSLK
jgi:hypothetical protein